MSNVAWAINTGGTVVVGTATIAANVFTDAAHGLTDGTAVEFDTISGSAVGILIEGHEYFVRNATTDTYQVSDTPGGEIMVIPSGGAQVRTAGPEYAAVDFRRLDAINGHPASADRWGVRTGVRPHSSAAVTLSGTTWVVNPTLARMYPRETSTSGPYTVAIERTEGTLTAADGSNPRLDALDVYIEDDDEDGSGQRRVPPVVYTAGTPASSPTAPLLLPGRLRLATILVPATGTPAPSISTESQFSEGPGILPARTATELPSTGMPEGAYVDRWDTNTLYRWDGAALQPVASQNLYAYWLAITGGSAVTGWTTYTPTVTGHGSATFSTRTGRWIRTAPKTVSWIVYLLVSGAGSGSDVLQVDSPTAPDRSVRQNVDLAVEGAATPSIRGGRVFLFPTGTGTTWDRLRWDTGSTSNALVNMGGSDLAVNMTISIQGTYMEA